MFEISCINIDNFLNFKFIEIIKIIDFFSYRFFLKQTFRFFYFIKIIIDGIYIYIYIRFLRKNIHKYIVMKKYNSITLSQLLFIKIKSIVYIEKYEHFCTRISIKLLLLQPYQTLYLILNPCLKISTTLITILKLHVNHSGR